MTGRSQIPLSVLDLAPVAVGATPAEALRHTRELAQHAEAWGFHRYWVAEHHNMAGIASAATSVVIGFIAGATSTIRVGSGGIMLPNHAPLVIAEQFGTLEALYPGRIDLGLGRAPGTDQIAMRTLRRGLSQTGDDFPELLEELRQFFRSATPAQSVRAVPGEGLRVPIFLLGSGGFSSRLAGQLGLPFASAGHFSPDNLLPGLELYRRSFKPSEVLERPYAVVAVNVIAADSDEEAAFLATSHHQAILNLVRGTPGKLPPPVKTLEGRWNPREQEAVGSFVRGSIVGGPAKVVAELEALVEETQADELIIHSMIFDHSARLHSYEILAGALLAEAALPVEHAGIQLTR
ncbi:MAG TPA: LLM class flavin-dependent oxidoreductase [Chthoniobacterales bacterium]